MKEEKLMDDLFASLKDTWDTEEPAQGHEYRFLGKLAQNKASMTKKSKKSTWVKPFSIAASITILMAVAAMLWMQNVPSREQQLANISPEVSQSRLYFANLIEEQVQELQSESVPETKQMVDDTMEQLEKLKSDYGSLEQDLINGGNSKLILSAMITNFQTRIDLLKEVLARVETIKNYKNDTDENTII